MNRQDPGAGMNELLETTLLPETVLKYAGLMGHRYIGVCTSKNGKRVVRFESYKHVNTDIEELFDPSDSHKVIYERTSTGWKIISKSYQSNKER